MKSHSTTPHPRLGLRVGITGTRRILPAVHELISVQVEETLSYIFEKVMSIKDQECARTVYNPTYRPLLRAISPLALGSDRIFAKAALANGYHLNVPIPFVQSEYELDFPDDIDEFRLLLSKASKNILVLDGGFDKSLKKGVPDSLRDASYEAVGRYVVRNSDIMIAIWDGKSARGRGGTGDVIKFALEHGVPVFWILADGTGEPKWIDKLCQLLRPEDHFCSTSAFLDLGAYLTSLLLPATSRSIDDQSFFFEASSFANWLPIWGAYKIMMRLLTWKRKNQPAVSKWFSRQSGTKVSVLPINNIQFYWDTFHQIIDTLALQCAARYRSSFILVVLLASITTLTAIFGISVEHYARQAAILELILLGLIGYIVRLNVSNRWHKGLIFYRLLAELIRDQQTLCMLGWSLPRARSFLNNYAAAPVPFFIWYFDAIVRTAPFLEGELKNTTLAQTYDFVVNNLIAGQLSYHISRRSAAEMASKRLSKGSKLFFRLTFIFVLAKCITLFLDWNEVSIVLDWITVVLPAISVAMANIRSYAEFEVIIDQSIFMEKVLTQSKEDLEKIALDFDAPSASSLLGHEILRLALEMRHETDGWAQFFRSKPVEAGG